MMSQEKRSPSMMASTKREPLDETFDLSASEMVATEMSSEDLLQPSNSGEESSKDCFIGKEFFLAESNKGKQTLVCCGYVYRRDHQGKKRVSWRCVRRDCSAQIKTNKAIDTITEDNGRGHNHVNDSRKMAKQFLRSACKRKAREDSSAKTKDIINSELSRFRQLGYTATSEENVKFLKMAMYRSRRKARSISSRQQRLVDSSKKKRVKDEPIRINLPQLPPPSSSSSSPPPPTSPSTLIPLPPTSYFQLAYEDNDDHFPLLGEHHPDPRFEGQNQDGHPGLPLGHTHHGDEETDAPDMSFTDTLLCPMEAASATSSQLCKSLDDQQASRNSPMDKGNIFNKDLPVDKDLSYFRCYADIRIHEEMLKDKVRTLAYRRALQENRSLLNGAIVLDVGAGTGILSHFALQAGAMKVFAVEASDMAVYAERIAMENNVGSLISVIHSKLEDAEIPVKVDALVSEWMGYNLLYESMLPSVLTARDRYLKPGGEMFPSTAALYLAPINDEEFPDRLKTWTQMGSLYGVSMESLVSLSMQTLVAKVETKHLQLESVVANACKVCYFDLKNLTHDQAMHVQSDFSFKCYGHNTVHAFATWFTVGFPGSVIIDTSPYALPTHWGQSVLYLKSPLSVEQDSEIFGSFQMKPSMENHRFWDISMDFHVNKGKKYIQCWQCKDT